MRGYCSRPQSCSCRPPRVRCCACGLTAAHQGQTVRGGRTRGSSAWSFRRGTHRGQGSGCCWRSPGRCRSAWTPPSGRCPSWSLATAPGPWSGWVSNTQRRPQLPPEPCAWCAEGCDLSPWTPKGFGRYGGASPLGCSRRWWLPQESGRRAGKHMSQTLGPNNCEDPGEPRCTQCLCGMKNIHHKSFPEFKLNLIWGSKQGAEL